MEQQPGRTPRIKNIFVRKSKKEKQSIPPGGTEFVRLKRKIFLFILLATLICVLLVIFSSI